MWRKETKLELKALGAITSFGVFAAGIIYSIAQDPRDRNWDQRNFDTSILLYGSLIGAVGLLFLASIFFQKRDDDNENNDEIGTKPNPFGMGLKVALFLTMSLIVGFNLILSFMFNMLNHSM